LNALARLFGAITKFFESKATAQGLVSRIEKLEAEHEQWRQMMVQLRTDVAKCKIMVGLNQVTDISPAEF
jgi:hypothetical protein